MNELTDILTQSIDCGMTDLYLTVGSVPLIRKNNEFSQIGETILNSDRINLFLQELLTGEQYAKFQINLEHNSGMFFGKKQVRLRINCYFQQHNPSLVIRKIKTEIPTIEMLKLPPIYSEIIMKKSGLILVCGPTGSGKTSSVTAMIDHRNIAASGHILTIEDPIEFVHTHKKCVISQREIGIDSISYSEAMKNALRQRADLIFVGEIRDKETMQHAISFAESGHLCVATLHAANSAQALSRVLHFFPEEEHKGICAIISEVILGIFSQRIIVTKDKEEMPITEIMQNVGFIRTLVKERRFSEISEQLKNSNQEAMYSFDNCLLKLYNENIITKEIALAYAENESNFAFRIAEKTMKHTSEF